jgi:hypothetical protein
VSYQHNLGSNRFFHLLMPYFMGSIYLVYVLDKNVESMIFSVLRERIMIRPLSTINVNGAGRRQMRPKGLGSIRQLGIRKIDPPARGAGPRQGNPP